jgi:hypothetical protein
MEASVVWQLQIHRRWVPHLPIRTRCSRIRCQTHCPARRRPPALRIHYGPVRPLHCAWIVRASELVAVVKCTAHRLPCGMAATPVHRDGATETRSADWGSRPTPPHRCPPPPAPGLAPPRRMVATVEAAPTPSALWSHSRVAAPRLHRVRPMRLIRHPSAPLRTSRARVDLRVSHVCSSVVRVCG